MDEEAVHQQRFREADEASTAKRALILGVPYRDMTNEEATIPLIQGMMEISDMYRYKMIPLAKGSYITPSIYGITLDTPESTLRRSGTLRVSGMKSSPTRHFAISCVAMTHPRT